MSRTGKPVIVTKQTLHWVLCSFVFWVEIYHKNESKALRAEGETPVSLFSKLTETPTGLFIMFVKLMYAFQLDRQLASFRPELHNTWTWTNTSGQTWQLIWWKICDFLMIWLKLVCLSAGIFSFWMERHTTPVWWMLRATSSHFPRSPTVTRQR